MKFKFKIQQYQADAVESTVRVFNGQGIFNQTGYRRDLGNIRKPETPTELFTNIRDEFGEEYDPYDESGYKNEDLQLSDNQLLHNIHEIQSQNNIKLSPVLIKDLGACSLDIQHAKPRRDHGRYLPSMARSDIRNQKRNATRISYILRRNAK